VNQADRTRDNQTRQPKPNFLVLFAKKIADNHQGADACEEEVSERQD
jgi:hypothetical protein